jgi:hypothetical protein
MFDFYFPKIQKILRQIFQGMLRGCWNKWKLVMCINWPKRQYLHVTTTTTTTASTAIITTTTTTTAITETTTSIVSTTKAEDVETKIRGNVEGKYELKIWVHKNMNSKYTICIQIADTGASATFLKRPIISRGNFRGIMSGVFSWPKGKLYLLLVLLLLIIVIQYYCYYCSFEYRY